MTRAMILAAGRGERMRPLTDTLPKPLLRAGGKPLVVWQIERLAAGGLRELVINLAHLGPVIESTLGDGRNHGVRIAYSREAQALDTAGGIAHALPLLGDAPFVVASGDVYADFDYSSLAPVASAMRADGRQAHLVLLDCEPRPPYGFALNAQSGRVERSASPQLTFAGIGVFHPSMFAGIPRGDRAPLLPLLLKGIDAGAISGQLHRGVFENLTTAADLDALDRRLRA